MSNFLDPAILFFVFGAFAGAVKSNLEVPQPIARFLSLYLLMALGLKGGLCAPKIRIYYRDCSGAWLGSIFGNHHSFDRLFVFKNQTQ